jgi:hypothetical protein
MKLFASKTSDCYISFVLFPLHNVLYVPYSMEVSIYLHELGVLSANGRVCDGGA